MLKRDFSGRLFKKRQRASIAVQIPLPLIDPDQSRTNINSPGAISSWSSTLMMGMYEATQASLFGWFSDSERMTWGTPMWSVV